MNKGIIVTLFFLGLGVSSVKAQLVAEKTHDVTRESKKGYLGNVVVDETKKQFDMVFVTKTKSKKIKFDVYQYDYDLNLLNSFSDEQEIEKAKTKYKWFNFRGKESETVIGVTAEASLTGQLVFKRKEITYNYNWFTGQYKKTVKVKGKLKPKTDEGKQMQAYGALDIDEKGEVIAMAGVKLKGMKNFENPMFHYRFLRINGDLDVLSSEDVILNYDHKPIWNGAIKNSAGVGQDPIEGDWGIILAPFKAGGYKKIAPQPNVYTFIRVGRDGKVKETSTFTTKVQTWKVIDIYEKDGSYFIYGPGVADKVEKSYYKGNDPQLKEKGFSHFQIVQLKDGKTNFVSATSFDEFKSKAKKPANQKKLTVYNGKKVEIRGLDISSNGDIFINAQDYSINTTGKYGGKIYKDLFMFHFSKDGKLRASYGIASTQSKGKLGLGGGLTDSRYYPTDGKIVPSSDGKKLHWYLFPIKKVFMEEEHYSTYDVTYYIPRTAPRVGSIKIDTGEMSEFQEFGGGKFYLFESHPFVSIEGGTNIIYLGEGGEKGRQIWLGKFDPSSL